MSSSQKNGYNWSFGFVPEHLHKGCGGELVDLGEDDGMVRWACLRCGASLTDADWGMMYVNEDPRRRKSKPKPDRYNR